jgi:hypothetical protein
MNPAGIILGIAVFVAAAAALVFWLPKIIRKGWIRRYESNEAAQLPFKYRISEDAFEHIAGEDSLSYSWEQLRARKETAGGFLIYVSEKQCYYLPKSCFANDPEGLEAVRGFIGALPEYKRKAARFGVSTILIASCIFFLIILIVGFVARLAA